MNEHSGVPSPDLIKTKTPLMHCFCQSEHRLSVPMGKVLNGPDERESILSSI